MEKKDSLLELQQPEDKKKDCPHHWIKKIIHGEKMLECLICGCIVSDVRN